MLFLLAEPQALTREGLKRVALDIDAACEFVEAADAAQASMALRNGLPLDAMVFDAALFTPEEVFALRQGRPEWLLIALIARDDQAAAARWFSAGVNALVPKAATTEVLSAALRSAMAGDVHVRGRSSLPPQPVFTQRRAYALRRGTGPLNLTARQYDVLALVAQDRSNKAIGTALGIGVRTVKGHVSVILRALHADNRIDAGRSARKWLARAGGRR
jgi:DNA-binding NarL/FixJ family response regulator